MDMTKAAEVKQHYKYFAFISYSSADVSWGKKLQRQLEHYRLPSRMQKKYPNTPKRAYPIFRDETNLSGFKVWDSLEKELIDSKYLIVLCSPRSAASDWVNDEIQCFIDLGREDRILPLIIDGIPYSGDPETECFPPALRNMKEAPLGISVDSLGWRNAYLKMVSTLLQIDCDELLLRDKRRRFRNGIVRATAGVSLAAGLFGLVWYNSEHSKYYSAYTLQGEIPVGLYEITDKKQLAATGECYRITTRRDKVVRLETVNSKGVVVDPYVTTAFTDYPILEYAYDDESQLICVTQKDATQMEITRKELTANPATNEIAIDFRSPSNALNAQSLSADMSSSMIGGQMQSVKSEITRQRNTYDNDDYLLQSLYQRDNLGTPACDSNGVYGKAYEYNDQGLIHRMWNLDESGKAFNCKYGWAYEEFTYNDSGKLILLEYFDADGNPARCKEGYSAERAAYDANGNLTRRETLDENGHLTYSVNGYAVTKASYNAEGLLISLSYFDTEEKPVYSDESFHEMQFDYDTQGRICGYRLYDISGSHIYSPTICFASQQLTRDKDGRILEIRILDIQGEPAFDAESGVCGYRYTYDKNGYLLETIALNEAWEPGTSKHGNAIVYTQRDGDGRILREECLDASGALVKNDFNCAVAVFQYDAFGNQTSVSYLDEDEKPCCNADGYARAEYTYKNGNLTCEKFFAPDGSPTANTAYYHECRMEYDGKGNCTRWSYYDTEGNPVNLKEGYAVVEQSYDPYGNVTQVLYFDAADNPACDRESGAYGFRWTYDKNGYACETAYLDAQGNPRISKYGYAKVENTYDAVGHVIRNTYFDANGNPICCSDGYASIEYSYDNVGNIIAIYAYDEQGNPCYHSEGYSSLKQVFENGKLLSAKSFDTDGKPMLGATYYHEVRYDYDDRGNRIRWSCYDTEGNLINNKDGYAVFAQTYDIYGNATETAYYTANGEPAYPLAVYKYEQEFDKQGNVIRTVRHSLYPDNLNAVITEAEYDVQGNPVVTRYFDEEGKPAVPISATKSAYDTKGNLIRTEHFRNSDIIGFQEFVYDEFGNEILNRFSLNTGTAQLNKAEQTRMTYDAFGNCIRTEHLDEEGKPALQKEGYATVVKGYSPTGNVIWCEYYDEAGNPALYQGHTFRYEYDYDPQGHMTEARMYDAEGKPHTEASGFAAVERFGYDVRGNRTYWGKFNEHGEPFGTAEDPYSATYYTIDSAGFIDREVYYDKNGSLVADYSAYAYIKDVYEGTNAFEAGVHYDQIIIQLGNWNYFAEHASNTSSDLKAEISRTVYSEKELVLCEWTEEDTFIFHRYNLPEGAMGVQVAGDMENTDIIGRMEEAYYEWLEKNPPDIAEPRA